MVAKQNYWLAALCTATCVLVAITVNGAKGPTATEATNFASNETPEVLPIPQDKIKPKKATEQQIEFPTGLKVEQTIYLNYEETEVVDIINQLAAKRGINVLLPQEPNTLKTKVTFKRSEPVSLDYAWSWLCTILKMAGFLLKERDDGLCEIVKDDANLNKTPIETFIGTDPDKLPNDDIKIRYLHFFKNMKVPPQGQEHSSELSPIFKDVLTKNSLVLFDASINAALIIDVATNIRSLMNILGQLDKRGFSSSVELLQLEYSSAKKIAELLTAKLIPQGQESAAAMRGGTAQSSQYFFTPGTKVVAEERSNSLIIMGTTGAVKRIKDFVKKYIDIPLETGKSVLHVYPLQYVIAEDMANLLTKIISSMSGSQSSGHSEHKHFQDVVIEYEPTPKSTSGSFSCGSEGASISLESGGGPKTTGNHLIIAARKRDWKKLKQIIRALDQPQPQVALEVLAVDLKTNKNKKLGAQIRNKKEMFPDELAAQAAMLTGSITNDNRGLLANLLQDTKDKGSLASTQTPGSLVFTINDPGTGGIWGLLSLLDGFSTKEVLSQPFVVTTNNQLTRVTREEMHYRKGSSKASSSNVTEIVYEPIKADISIEILPTINKNGMISMQIVVSINEFTQSASSETQERAIRSIKTNAYVRDGGVIILGGLIKNTIKRTGNETPILGQIPIIGNLFKTRSRDVIRDNLLVFISPKIVRPKATKELMAAYSDKKLLKATKALSKGENFENLHDPITRFMFGEEGISEKKIVKSFATREMLRAFDVDEPKETNAETAPKAQQSVKEFTKPEDLKENTEQASEVDSKAAKLKKLIEQERLSQPAAKTIGQNTTSS